MKSFLVIFFIGLLTAISGWSENLERKATITFLLGKVETRQDSLSEWKIVAIGDSLSSDSEIKTGEDSMVKLECEDGLALTLGASSVLSLRALIEDAQKIKDKQWIRTIWKKIMVLMGKCEEEPVSTGGGVRGEPDTTEVEMQPYWADEENDAPTRSSIKFAIKVLEEIVKDEETKSAPLAQYLIGECFEKLEDIENALVAYKKVVESYPETKWAEYAEEKIEKIEETEEQGDKKTEEE